MKSVAEKSLQFASLFEAEVLVRLMLWRWNHPRADDADYAHDVLENTAEILREATEGQEFIEGLPPASMNFVAAVYYAEYCADQSGDTDPAVAAGRRAWLEAVRRALPSCFVNPSRLAP